MREKSHAAGNLILLIQGQFVSNFGNQLFDIAILLWLKELTGSAAVMGLALLLTNLPEALLAPAGGVLADRFSKVKLLVLSDIASGLFIGIAVLAAVLPVGTTVKVSAILVTNLLLGLSAACFVPAVSALIPGIVSANRLEKANAAHRFSGTGARILGQSMGGIIFSGYGIVIVFFINSVSFILSAVSEMFIRVPAGKTAVSPSRSFAEDIADSLRNIWKTPSLRRLLVYIGAFHLCLASLPVTLPFFAESRLHLSGKWLGILIGLYTAGIMIGFIIAGGIAGFSINRHKIIVFSALLCGFLFIMLGLSGSIWITCAVLVCIGAAIGVIVINLITELQKSAPEHEIGRIMGAAQAVGGSSLPVGMALFGLALDLMRRFGDTGTAASIIFISCGTAALVLGFIFLRTIREH